MPIEEWKGRSVQAYYEPGAAKLEDLQKFDELVGAVNRFASPLKVPPPPALLISRNELSPRAMPLDNRIFLGTRLGFQDPRKSGAGGQTWFRSPEYMKAVLAHEYGHLIFDVNFEEREPLVKEAYRAIAKFEKEAERIRVKMQENREEMAKLTLELLTAMASNDEAAAKKCLEKAISLDLEFKKMPLELQPHLEEISAYQELVLQHVTAYNEFFADVVAVLYAERSDAISRSVYSVHFAQIGKFHDVVKAGSDYRDFDKHIAPRVGKNPLKKGMTAPYLEDHNYLEPTRNFLWNSYLASPTILKTKKSEVLEAVFNAVSLELRYRMNNYDKKSSENWQAFNDRLIGAISLEMSKRGIESLK